MMNIVSRWLRRSDPEPAGESSAETLAADETITQVSAQVAELRRALRRIEAREAARRHGRPEPA